MSDSGSSSSSEEHLLKRLRKLKRKYRKAKRRQRQRRHSSTSSRSRSRSREEQRCRPRQDHRSPSGSGSHINERGRSRTPTDNLDRQNLEGRDYRSPRGSESCRNNSADRSLRNSAAILPLGNHDLNNMVPQNIDIRGEDNAHGNSPVLELLNDEVLPDEFLEILGDDPEKKTKDPFLVHTALASRWGHVGKKGLPKTERNALLERYPLPENFNENLKPPKVNPEIKNILSTTLSKRDNSYLGIQEQVCAGISATAKALDEILRDKENIPRTQKSKLLEYLGDSGRILASLVHDITTTRRSLIIPNLSKSVKDLIENISPTEYLFGNDLSEKIKNAKYLERTSKDLKIAVPSSIPSFKRYPYNRGRPNDTIATRSYSGPSTSLNKNRPVRQQQGEARPQKGHTPRKQYNRRRQPSKY